MIDPGFARYEIYFFFLKKFNKKNGIQYLEMSLFTPKRLDS